MVRLKISYSWGLILHVLLHVLMVSSNNNGNEQIGLSEHRRDIGRNITKILDSFFAHGYDKRVRPNYGGRPVEVLVSMFIVSISSVSEVLMDFTTDFYFRQLWTDSRLSFQPSPEIDALFVGAEVADRIWVPDTFFANEKSAYFHIATTPNTFLRINHKGEVLRSMRLTVTASCPMDLQYFPMDRQKCAIEVESYGYSMKDIMYKWKNDAAVGVDEGLILPQFRILGHNQRDKTINLSTGNYSRLICEVNLVRSMGYYLIQIYIPASLIVVISWVSFWLHRNATPARVQLGVLTVLTMTTLMSSTNSQLPKISYVKSIDVFLGTCFVMVFAALLEYAAVGYIGKRISMRKNRFQQLQKSVEEKRRRLLDSAGATSSSDHHHRQQIPLRQHHPRTSTYRIVDPSSSSPPSILKFRSCEELHSPRDGGHFVQPIQHFFPPLTHPYAFHLPPPSHVVVQQQPPPSGAPPPVPPPPPPNSLSHFATIRRSHHHGHHHHHQHQRPVHDVPIASASSDEQLHHLHHHQQQVQPLGASSSSHHHPIMSTMTAPSRSSHHHQQLHRHHSVASTSAAAHHRPQEVRLDMVSGSKGGTSTTIAHSISVGDLDPTSPPSSGNLATTGSGMESSGLRNRAASAHHHQQLHRQSVYASAAGGINNNNGNGSGGPSSPHPVTATATTGGATRVQLNIPIPKNLNELFGVSPSDIDKYSRVVFPVCFVCFNLMYWMIYLHISKILDPEGAFVDEG